MISGRATFSPAMEIATGYNKWVISAFAPVLEGPILEVGFGHDGFRALLPRGARHIVVDIDPEVVREARARHPDELVVEADVASPAFLDALGARRIDAVLCVNVLEHVSNDASAMLNLLSCLRPHGHLCILVPAFPALYNDLDRLAGHERRYRVEGLRALVPPDLGRVERLEYFNPVGGLGWWLNGLVRHRRLSAPAIAWQVRFFDSVARPVSMVMNRLTRRVFGQSVLAVVERL